MFYHRDTREIYQGFTVDYLYIRSLQVRLIIICGIGQIQCRMLTQMMHLTIKIAVFHRIRTPINHVSAETLTEDH